MLHILFLILKIIGIIALAILGILILLICVALFVPVRYRFQAETTQGVPNLKLHGKASWLLHLAAAYVDYNDRKLNWQVRVLWKKFHIEEESKGKQNEDDIIGEDIDDKKPEDKTMETETSKTMNAAVGKADAEETHSEDEEAEGTESSTKNTKKQNFVDKIRYTIREICDKIKKILETKDRIVEFISDEIHQAAFARVIKEIRALVKRLCPKKLKGKVRFGLKEPYDTGRVLAVLSVLYPFYGENVQIYPEFEREVLEGSLVMKGRVRLFPFAITICNLFFDKNVKTAYKNFRRK